MANKSTTLTVSTKYSTQEFVSLTQTILQSESEHKLTEPHLDSKIEALEKDSDPVIITDLEFKVRFWNNAAERIYGWQADEILGCSLEEITSIEYRGCGREEVMAQLLRDGVWRGEVTQQRQDKQRIKTLVSIAPLADKLGKPMGVVIVNRDTTERRQNLENLVNKRTVQLREEVTRRKEAEIKLKEINQEFEDSLENYEAVLAELRFSRKALEAEIIEREQIGVELRQAKDELETRVQERTAELSRVNETLRIENEQRQQIEKKLRESEEKFRSLIEAASVGIVVIDQNGRIVLANPKAEEMFGYDKGELLEQEIEILLPESFRKIHAKHRTNYFSSPSTRFMGGALDLAGRRKDGSEFPVEIGLSPVKTGQESLAIGYITDITERIKAEEIALKLAAIVESSEDAIIGKTLDGIITSWNKGAENVYGYTATEAVGQHISMLLSIERLEEVAVMLEKLKSGERIDRQETTHLRKKGDEIYVSSTISPVLDASGNVTGVATITRDITERKRAEATLQYRLRFEKVITTLSTYFIYLAPDEIDTGIETALATIGEFIEVDHSYIAQFSDDTTLLYYTHEWYATGVEPQAVSIEGLPVDIYSWSMKKLLRFEPVHISRMADLPPEASTEKELLQTYNVQSSISIPMVYHKKLIGVLGLISYETERTWSQDVISLLKIVGEMFVNALQRKKAEEALHYQAFHDDLTHLPNRTLLTKRIEEAIARARYKDNYRFAVLFMDLNRFKVINDSLGHMIGDQLLSIIARRLQTCVRTGDMVARMGGDEFVILIENIDDVDDVIQIAERIQEAVSWPINLEGHQISTSASIGIVLSTIDNYERPVEILRDADVAMYQAKTLVQGQYKIFHPSMRATAMSIWHLEADLRQAVEQEAFELYYQPIVSLKNGQIVGAEALIRWQHPKRGLISPAQFIPLAEETGLITTIGEWVLRTACAQLKRWRQAGSSSELLRVAVNLSTKQLQQTDLLHLIKQTLVEADLPPDALELEITEGPTVMPDMELIMALLNNIRSLGLRISIDDFGLGYSSLGRLQHFPIDTLKIDRSFIDGIGTQQNDAVLASAVIEMGHGLKLNVLGEGVETEEQLHFLRLKHCDELQGYFFSRPVPAETMTQFLRDGLSLPDLKQMKTTGRDG